MYIVNGQFTTKNPEITKMLGYGPSQNKTRPELIRITRGSFLTDYLIIPSIKNA